MYGKQIFYEGTFRGAYIGKYPTHTPLPLLLGGWVISADVFWGENTKREKENRGNVQKKGERQNIKRKL
jgi:hypothetical protein